MKRSAKPPPKPAVKYPSFVYFIQDTGPSAEIKIGSCQASLRQRVLTLQTGNPRALIPLGALRFDEPSDAGGVEGQLHLQFAQHHVRGDWFRPGAELVAFIREKFPGADVMESSGEEARLVAPNVVAALRCAALGVERARALLGDRPVRLPSGRGRSKPRGTPTLVSADGFNLGPLFSRLGQGAA